MVNPSNDSKDIQPVYLEKLWKKYWEMEYKKMCLWGRDRATGLENVAQKFIG